MHVPRFVQGWKGGAMAVAASAALVVPMLATAQTSDPVEVNQATEQWQLITRNTYGSPSVQFGSGPVGDNQAQPSGTGSLHVLVDGPSAGGDTTDAEKMNFGMPQTPESALWGTPVAEIGDIGYWVYDGTENGDASLPNIQIEVARDGVAAGGYASFVFLPAQSTPVDGTQDLKHWEQYDAKAGTWYSTSGDPCGLGSPCTWSELTTAYPDAEVWFSAGISKGRDNEFTGAVDLVTFDGVTYDFEPGGKRGPEGPQGPEGPEGPQGPAGPEGPAGEDADLLPPVEGPDRLAGANRLETSVEIAQFRFPDGSPAVYLARNDVFADALAGNSLLGPVLLVRTCELPAVVETYLNDTTPERVTALGGTEAICDDVLNQAKAAAGIN